MVKNHRSHRMDRLGVDGCSEDPHTEFHSERVVLASLISAPILRPRKDTRRLSCYRIIAQQNVFEKQLERRVVARRLYAI